MYLRTYGLRNLNEHYLDFYADEEARGDGGKQSCFVTSTELFERLEEESSLNEHIIEVQAYTEPQSWWGLFSFPFGNHFFVILETRNWWWSIEVRNHSVIIQRAKDFTNVQSRSQGRYRRYKLFNYGPSFIWRRFCTHRRIRDIIVAMYREGFFHDDEEEKVLTDGLSSQAFVGLIWAITEMQRSGKDQQVCSFPDAESNIKKIFYFLRNKEGKRKIQW